MMTTSALDDRYGRTTSPVRKRIWWIAFGTVAVAAVGYFGWSTVASNMDAVAADGLGFTVVDDKTVEVSFQVTAPRGREVVCALEALDEEFGVVGYRVVSYGASDQHAQRFTTKIRTVAEATTGLVTGCWVA